MSETEKGRDTGRWQIGQGDKRESSKNISEDDQSVKRSRHMSH